MDRVFEPDGPVKHLSLERMCDLIEGAQWSETQETPGIMLTVAHTQEGKTILCIQGLISDDAVAVDLYAATLAALSRSRRAA